MACIGNSITDGMGIDMSEVYGYPAVLQRLLGKNYNVKNFGVSARTLMNKGDLPYMKEQAWADAQAFLPNIVVIKLGTNDSKDYNWIHGADYGAACRRWSTRCAPCPRNLRSTCAVLSRPPASGASPTA